MRSILRHIMLGFALFALATSTSIAADPAKKPIGLGTWKLNVEKSKYNPGPPPKSLTVKFESAGSDGLKLTTDGVAADGKPIATEYTAKYDGKDYPIKGSPTVDTISLRYINSRKTVRTDKKDGKFVQTQTRDIAKDGKSMTVTIKGKNAKGEPIHHVLLFEKV